MDVAIIVLNYNGEELLRECLPSIVNAASSSRHKTRVIVIDNCSTDKSLQVLESEFEKVEVIKARENKFLISYNEILEPIQEEIVILLNNDIKVDEGFIDPLADYFKDKNVLFVAPKVLHFDGTYNGGKSYLRMRYGIIKVEVDTKTYQQAGITHTIAGGAFRRELFLSLGGYDSIYLPGYWEDTDLCYRGLKYGFKGLYEPRSVIYHKEHATFSKKFSWRRKMAIVDRNMFIFTWKNISDPLLWFEHSIFIIPRILYSLFAGKPHLMWGFFMAVKKAPEILKRRAYGSWGYRVSDREIIKT